MPKAVEATATKDAGPKPSRQILLDSASKELVFAVVGHVGSGTSEVAKALSELLSRAALAGGAFDTTILKAKVEIEDCARSRGKALPAGAANELATAEAYQNLGDAMREERGDYTAVAASLVRRIRATRAAKRGIPTVSGQPIDPDGTRRAYILDAIRHPAEVNLLRAIYQEAFVLVGVVCEEEVRLERLTRDKFRNAGRVDAHRFMERDARAPEKHGQRVSDAFYLADFFVDNTSERFLPGSGGRTNPAWEVNDKASKGWRKPPL